MTLERARLGLLAALAATIPVSIFASQMLLRAVARGAARPPARAGRAPPRRARRSTRPLLALRRSGRCSPPRSRPSPRSSHEDSKKLLLFALFYVAVEALAPAEDRERVLAAALLGGLALAGADGRCSTTASATTGSTRRPPRLPRPLHVGLGRHDGASCCWPWRGSPSGRAPGPGRRTCGCPRRCSPAWPRSRSPRRAGTASVATRLFVAALARGRGAWRSPGLARPRARGRSGACRSSSLPLAAWALVISQTRSAWIGVAAGLVALAALALLRAPRLVWAALAVAAVAPAREARGGIRSRLTDRSTRAAATATTCGRPASTWCWTSRSSARGPGMILVVYPRYRWPEAPNPRQPHLHNNAAADRRRARAARARLLPVVGRRSRSWRRCARRGARPAAGRGPRLGGGRSARRARRGLRGRALRIQSRRLRGPDARPAADGRAVRAASAGAPGLTPRGPAHLGAAPGRCCARCATSACSCSAT